VASLSQGRTAAAQCGLFTHKSVPVIFEPPCTSQNTRKNYENFYSVTINIEQCSWSARFREEIFFFAEIRVSDHPVLP